LPHWIEPREPRPELADRTLADAPYEIGPEQAPGHVVARIVDSARRVDRDQAAHADDRGDHDRAPTSPGIAKVARADHADGGNERKPQCDAAQRRQVG